MMSLNRPAPATMGSVASLLAMDRTTLTAALKPLERRSLVAITADPEDRRSRRLTLTPSGLSLLASAVPVWERTHRDVEGRLANADPDRLRHDLRALS
jgi:DNA-binding MarR family transcriptional regulator